MKKEIKNKRIPVEMLVDFGLGTRVVQGSAIITNDCHEVGEVAKGWPEFEDRKGYKYVDKLQEKIDKAFNEWLVETKQVPDFYRILPLADPVIIPN